MSLCIQTGRVVGVHSSGMLHCHFVLVLHYNKQHAYLRLHTRIATFPLVSLSTRAAVKERKARESIIDSIRKIIKQEGISGLYDGLGSSLWAISLTNASFYFFFEEVRAIIIRRKNKIKLSTFDSILASFIAGCGTSIVTNPIWVINTNQISQASLSQDLSEVDGDDDASNSSSKLTTKLDPKTGQKIVVKKLGFIQTLKKIYKNGGLSAFFRGLGPALVLVINPIIAYTAFEQFKNILIARRLGNARAVRPISNSITAKPAVAPLSDLDNFLLGAVSLSFLKFTFGFTEESKIYMTTNPNLR